MRFVQGPRIPTVVVAIYGTVFIGHPKVPDDLCPCGIDGDNFGGSMQRTFCLIEIDRACYVRGELGGLVTRFSNSVYLDGERDGNAHLPQLTGECNCLRSTPTVPVDDNCRSLFLEGREDAVVVGIEEAHDLTEGLSTMVIPEHFRMDEGVTVAKICGKLHFWMLCVIPTNKASNKPNDDHVSDAGSSYRRTHFLK